MTNIILTLIDKDKVDIPMALLISLICFVVVFTILILIIVICHFLFKGIDTVDNMINVNAKHKENEILNEDKDAQVALIVATIEYQKETGQNVKVKSIKRID